MAVVAETVPELDVGVYAPDGQVHPGETEGGLVGLLPIDGQVAERLFSVSDSAPAPVTGCMSLYELDGLDEHARGAATGVKYSSPVRLDHFHQQSYHGAGRVELAALAAFGDGELFQEILVDLSQNVGCLCLSAADPDVAYQVHDLTQDLLVQVVSAKVLGQNSLQGFVVPFDDVHGPVDGGSDVLLAGPGLDDGPSGLLGDPEYVPFPVLVGLFGVEALVYFRLELFV